MEWCGEALIEGGSEKREARSEKPCRFMLKISSSSFVLSPAFPHCCPLAYEGVSDSIVPLPVQLHLPRFVNVDHLITFAQRSDKSLVEMQYTVLAASAFAASALAQSSSGIDQ